MLRSPKHRLSLAAYVGTGLALALRNRLLWFCALAGVETVAGGGDPFLSLPLVNSFFLLRMRFIYNILSELSANRIFQDTERAENGGLPRRARACMLLTVVGPVAAAVLIGHSVLFDPAADVIHAAYCSLLSLLLVEALLWRREKLPFTCSYAPTRVL
jgi:hypothetical protein